VLDQNGAKVDEIRYYPYGAERWPLDGTFPTDYRFTGQKYEAGVGGLYQMGARWYDPSLNQFVSPDSIIPDFSNPQSLNRYAYALANPCRYRDPTGHCIWDGCIAEIIAIGAGVGLIVDYSMQVKENMSRGLSFWDAVFHKNIDEGEMVGAAASGAVMAGTFEVVGPTSFAGYLATGGVGGFLGGQTGRFVSAGIHDH
jgi:RHS repeat-associated protein